MRLIRLVQTLPVSVIFLPVSRTGPISLLFGTSSQDSHLLQGGPPDTLHCLRPLGGRVSDSNTVPTPPPRPYLPRSPGDNRESARRRWTVCRSIVGPTFLLVRWTRMARWTWRRRGTTFTSVTLYFGWRVTFEIPLWLFSESRRGLFDHTSRSFPDLSGYSFLPGGSPFTWSSLRGDLLHLPRTGTF